MTSVAPPPLPVLPLLESGDQISRDEFERRYEAMPWVKRAELVEGVVFMPSPVRLDQHGEQHAALMTWLGVYWAGTRGVRVGDNTSVRLDLDNEPQPDALMLLRSQLGGQAAIDDQGYIAGAPELVAEVAASNAALALNTKLRVYRRNRVREYLVWRVLDQAFDWFILRQTQYERLAPGADGILRSEVFPGLWLDPAALLRLDLAEVLRVQQLGLASAEHAAFADRLRQTGP